MKLKHCVIGYHDHGCKMLQISMSAMTGQMVVINSVLTAMVLMNACAILVIEE